MNREEILREIGITPLWKVRGAGAGQDAQRVYSVAAAAPETSNEDEPPPYLSEGPPMAEERRAAEPRIAARPQRESAPAAAGVDPVRVEHIARMEWPDLKGAVAECTACTLCEGRKKTVFGVGDEAADWMIIGEAPGAEEDARGEPFVGQAGRLLDSMLAALDMKREVNVYIANVLKCRPPGNRNPEALEVAQCSPHLLRQVALIQPKLIILMGRFAAQTLLNTDASIASMRGRLHQYQGTPAIVTYHPAYLLRNLPDKSKAWADLLFARQTYQGLQGVAAAQ
jgi:uracil-DNA glycosylase family 4